MQSRRQLLLLGVLVAMLVVGTVLLWPSAGPVTATPGGYDSITSPDTDGDVGKCSSLALDANGYPVASYHDHTNGNLKVMHCNDANCVGGDESITSPDAGTSYVGQYTSLVLDASGNPVVSYYDFTYGYRDLKLLHCDDPNCAGGDESITSPDTGGDVGADSSLALDANGYPVVSYIGPGRESLRVLHCNDPNCAGGDESITEPDPSTVAFYGASTSLVLDAGGNPVVSYLNGADVGVKLLHCNDPDCSGDDESVTLVAGLLQGCCTSLALDASGYPAISYTWIGETDSGLGLVHCNDPNCIGGDESHAFPDPSHTVGMDTSLVLDASGNPVVSYHAQGGLGVLHCGNPDCTAGNTLEVPDRAGSMYHTSLVLDATGNPVVTYHDSYENQDLKVLHCNDPDCIGGDIDHDGCPDWAEQQTAPGRELLGGLRDLKNAWDYFNPTNDGVNLVDDILVVVDHYGLEDGQGGYDEKYDRTYEGPSAWNLGPPDGVILVADILHAVAQYGHDCGEGVVKPTPTPTVTPTPTPMSYPLDFSIGVDTDGDTTDDCDTLGGPTKCVVWPDETFELKVYLNELPAGVSAYLGFDLSAEYEGVLSKDNASNEAWPDCVYSAVDYSPGVVRWSCSIGVSEPLSTYLGVIGTNDFNCEASGTVTMVHGTGGLETKLYENATTQYAEGQGTTEALMINCHWPTVTPTPP